jgi:hypothetical protein
MYECGEVEVVEAVVAVDVAGTGACCGTVVQSLVKGAVTRVRVVDAGTVAGPE